jgi:hypothetical protein
MEITGDGLSARARLGDPGDRGVGRTTASSVETDEGLLDLAEDPVVGPAAARCAVAHAGEQVVGIGRATTTARAPLSVDEIHAAIDRALHDIVTGKWQKTSSPGDNRASDAQAEPGFALSPAASRAFAAAIAQTGKAFARTLEVDGRTLELVFLRTLSPEYDRILKVFADGKLEAAGRIEFKNPGRASIDWTASIPRPLESLLDARASSVLDAVRALRGSDEHLASDPAVARALELTFHGEPKIGGPTSSWPFRSLRELVAAAVAKSTLPSMEAQLNALAGESGQLSAEGLVRWLGAGTAAGAFGANLVRAIAAHALPDLANTTTDGAA